MVSATVQSQPQASQPKTKQYYLANLRLQELALLLVFPTLCIGNSSTGG